jgi:rhamnosyltransferase subunit B
MTALGSYGDVHPMVGLGSAMRERGHQVTVITNPHFQSVVEEAGLGLLPLGTVAEYDELAHHPDLWHPVRGPFLVLKIGTLQSLRPIYELLEEHYQPGETVLVAPGLDMASRVFQDKHQAPLASVHFAPVAIRSFYDSPKMFYMLMSKRTPRWLRRAQFWAADKFAADPLLGPEINKLRGEQGLPPVSGIMRDWYFSPQLVLGLFPEWFAAVQPDWPPNTHLTGFPLWDQSSNTELPSEVAEYLDAGEPPIVFAPGSAMTSGEDFFSAAAEACQQLGRRGVLLTRYPDQLPKQLPAEVRHFDFVPFSHLLPRAAALVHHGGIGTSSQGLAAGVPHLVMPMAYDQLDNATRLQRLGVAEVVRRPKFRGPRVAQALQRLLASQEVQANCKRWSEKTNGEATLTASCELLEGLL